MDVDLTTAQSVEVGTPQMVLNIVESMAVF